MCVIVRTIAGVPVICRADPVVALAAWAEELPGICGPAEADAAVTLAPPTADLAIRCPAAAQGRLCGQLTHTTHLAGEKNEGQFFHVAVEVKGSSWLPSVSVLKQKITHLSQNTFVQTCPSLYNSRDLPIQDGSYVQCLCIHNWFNRVQLQGKDSPNLYKVQIWAWHVSFHSLGGYFTSTYWMKKSLRW